MYYRGNVARPESAQESCALLQSKRGCRGSPPGGLWEGARVIVPSPSEYAFESEGCGRLRGGDNSRSTLGRSAPSDARVEGRDSGWQDQGVGGMVRSTGGTGTSKSRDGPSSYYYSLIPITNVWH